MTDKNLFDRIFDRTIRNEYDCDVWQGACSSRGYGAIKVHGKMEATHRMAYVLCNGDIPNGLYVCHTCDNRRCVNPAHLFLGTAKDNKADCMAKLRHAYGEEHPHSKLSNEDTIKIRELLDTTNLSQEEIGRRFGIAQCTVSQIKQGTARRLTQ